MNKGMFGHTAKVGSKGYVTLDPRTVKGKANARQPAMHDYLNQIIADPAEVAVMSSLEPRPSSAAMSPARST